jgi:hypothetical protein
MKTTQQAPSLPLEATLALAEHEAHARRFKQRLATKLRRLSELEQTDFVSHPDAFGRYAALRRDTAAMIDFLQLTEQTLRSLGDRASCGPLRLKHYHRLWVDNHHLQKQLAFLQSQYNALQAHSQLLSQVNDVLTDRVLNHSATNHSTTNHPENRYGQVPF